jgi:hypothetical protein
LVVEEGQQRIETSEEGDLKSKLMKRRGRRAKTTRSKLIRAKTTLSTLIHQIDAYTETKKRSHNNAYTETGRGAKTTLSLLIQRQEEG